MPNMKNLFKKPDRKERAGAEEAMGPKAGRAGRAEPKTRIYLIRHGEPEQHSGKIFLGQYDVPLSENGKHQASMAGDSLARRQARPKRIHTSDLLRARETADIIAEKLGGIPVMPDKLFREMAMGIWDGELIEDIKEKFPEEYAKRGDDLRNYRVPGGENFYDLYGRVTREFYRVFAQDIQNGGGDPGDLVIVAHLGVINALAEDLHKGSSGPYRPKHFSTGEIVAIDVPEWLLPLRGSL